MSEIKEEELPLQNRYRSRGNRIDRHELPAKPDECTHEPASADSAKRRAYRDALFEFALSEPASHWVTLNFYREATPDAVSRCLRRWRVEVFRRLHGQRFHDLPQGELTYFFGCPELKPAGSPHVHLVCRVPEPLHAKFIRVATARWKAIVPSGDVYIVPIGPTEADQRRVLGYALKWLDPSSALPFVDSRMY